MTIRPFGIATDGEPVERATLVVDGGLEVSILTWGAAVQRTGVGGPIG